MVKIDINKKYRTIDGEYVNIERICFGKVFGVIHTPSGDVFTIWWEDDGEIFKSEHIEMDLESDKLNLVEIVEEGSATFSKKPVTWDVFTEYQELQNMELARLNNELVDLRSSRGELEKETRKRVAALVELNKETKKDLRKELIDLKSCQIASSGFIVLSLAMSAITIIINLSK